MAVDRAPERQLLQLMGRQHGLATRQQAAGLGLGRRRIEHLVRDGYVRRASPGLYRLLGARIDWPARVMAACLGVEGAVASHSTALGLHLGPDFQHTGELHVVVPRRGGSGPRELLDCTVAVHRATSLDSKERCRVGAIPATTPARTLLDLAGSPTTPFPTVTDLDVVLGELLATKRLRPASLLRALDERSPRCPGQQTVRLALERALLVDVERTESRAERRFLMLAVASGTPAPTVQLNIHGPRGGLVGRVDFAWQQSRLVVEIDGSRWHSSLSAQARDRGRDRRLTANGWRVLRFTPADLRDRAGAVLSALMEGLGDAHALR